MRLAKILLVLTAFTVTLITISSASQLVHAAETPLPKILLVYDAIDPTLINPSEMLDKYKTTLSALGFNDRGSCISENGWVELKPGEFCYYNTHASNALPLTSEDLMNFDIVIWFTGTDLSDEALKETDINNLKEYLASGGKLFLSGENWMESIEDLDFLKNYLHIKLCKSNSPYVDANIVGKPNTFIGDDYEDDPISLSQTAPNIFYHEGIFEGSITGYICDGSLWRGRCYGEWSQINITILNSSSPYIYSLEFIDDNSALNFVCLDPGEAQEDIFGNTYYPCERRVRLYLYECVGGYLGTQEPFNGVTAITHDNGTNSYKVVLFGFEWATIEDDLKRLEIMRRVIGFLTEPRAIKVVLDRNVTCDPLDSYCEYSGYPQIEGVCELRKDPWYMRYVCYYVWSWSELSWVETCRWKYDPDQLSKLDSWQYVVNYSSISKTGGFVYSEDYKLPVQLTTDYYYSYYYNNFSTYINVSDLPDGTYNVGVRCQDSENDWGGFANLTLVVDKTRPQTPYVVAGQHFVNTETAEFKLYYRYRESAASVFEITDLPAYVSYSCDNSSWSGWIAWSDLQDGEESNGQDYNFYKLVEVDITSAAAGCSSSEGNRTVYFRFRDKAGNIAYDLSGKPNYNWVVYDTTPPWFTITPSENSWVSPSSRFTVLVYDDWKAKGDVHYYIYNTSDQLVKHNLTENGTEFLPFEGLKDGTYTLKIFCWDEAGNTNVTDLTYKLDTKPPVIASIPENNSVVWKRLNINLTWDDPVSWIDNVGTKYRSGTNDTGIVELDGTNITVQNGVPFQVEFETSGWHSLKVWVWDNAGNVNATTLRFFADVDPPIISNIDPVNNSIITLENWINISAIDMPEERNAGLNSTGIRNNGNGTNLTFAINYPFYPGWNESDEGDVWLDVWIFDLFNNTNHTRIHYLLDVNPPTTTDNYSAYIQANGWSWLSHNIAIELSCDDAASGCYRTYYCLSASPACDPENEYTTPVLTGCPEGEACTYYLRYYSVDAAGHEESIKEAAANISIDRAPPTILVLSPENNSVQSGNVTIKVQLSDKGSGAEGSAFYYIFNSTWNLIESGELSSANDYTATWNSSAYNGTHYIIVNATDIAGNVGEVMVKINIDNTYPSAMILLPERDSYHNTTHIQIYLVGEKGTGLSSCNYTVTNSTGSVIFSGMNTTVGGATTCEFNETLDFSAYRDDVYTIQFNVSDTAGHMSAVFSQFIIDTTPPTVAIHSPENSSLVSNTISINYTVNDINCDDVTIYYRKNSTASWQKLADVSCGSHQVVEFFTSLCQDSNTPECGIKLTAADKAGNVNHTTVYLQVDNSPPEMELVSPPQNSWHGKTFNITLSITDAHSDVVECNYTTEYVNGVFDCSKLEVVLPEYCMSEGYGECKITITAKNGANLTSTRTFTFSTDYTPPELTSVTPQNLSVILNTTPLTFEWEDNFDYYGTTNNTGVVELENGTNVTIGNGVAFSPHLSGDGWHILNVWVSDIAGNTKMYALKYYVDEKPPEIISVNTTPGSDAIYGDVRIFEGEVFYLDVGVNDTAGVAGVKANVTLPNGTEKVVYAYLLEGTNTLGVWRVAVAGDTLGKYNITSLQLADVFGHANTTKLGLTFFVVKPELRVLINGTNESNYWVVSPFILNFTFNKTVDRGELSFMIPPSTCGILNGAPAYTIINYTSLTEACNLTPITDGDSLLGWNVNITNPTNYCGVEGYLFGEKVSAQDIVERWYACFSSGSYRDDTLLRISNMVAELNTSPARTHFAQNETFQLVLNVTNLLDANHSGTAINVSIELVPPECYNNYCNITITPEFIQHLGNIAPNTTGLVVWNVTVENAGNYTFLTRVMENGTSILERGINVTVNDTTPPTILGYWFEDNRTEYYAGDVVRFVAWIVDNVDVNSSKLYVKKQDGEVEIVNGSGNYGVWLFSITNTSQVGNYTILSIYAEDDAGNYINESVNMTFRVLKMIVDVRNAKISTIESPLNISVWVKGNITEISSVSVNVTKPRGSSETLHLEFCNTTGDFFVYCGTYYGVTQSGNYSINVTVSDTIGSAANHSWFFVDYGVGEIIYAETYSGTVKLPLTALHHNMTWIVLIKNGDLQNVTLNITIENTSVAYLAQGENGSKRFDHIYYEDNPNGLLVGWNITLNSTGSTLINVTINTSKNFNFSVINLTVIPTDDVAPSIEMVDIKPNYTNLMSPVTITTKVIDHETLVESVVAEITLPNGTALNITMVRFNATHFQATYQNIPVTGVYWVRIFAKDAGNNVAVSPYDSFNATDVYPYFNVEPAYYSYNKGEYIRAIFDVRDVNNNTVNDFTYHAIINMSGIKVIELSGTGSSSVNTLLYRIEMYDPPILENQSFLTYNVTVWVEKDGNVAMNRSFVIRVYREFNVTVIEPASSHEYLQYIPLVIEVKNARGQPVTWISGAEAWCLDGCSNPQTRYPYATLVYAGQLGRYANLQAFSPFVGVEEAKVMVYVSDVNRNEKSVVRNVVIGQEVLAQAGEGGGGGEKGGATGGMAGNFTTLPIKIEEFQMRLTKDVVEIEQGKDGSVALILINPNPVEIVLLGGVDVEGELQASAPKVIYLSPKEERTVLIEISAPLYLQAGEYLLVVQYSYENVSKSLPLTVKVIESEEVKNLRSLVNSYNKLVRFLKSVNQTHLYEKELKDIDGLIKKAHSDCILKNDEQCLKEVNEIIAQKIEGIENRIFMARVRIFVHEYRKEIMLALLLAAIMAILTELLLLPLIRINRKLSEAKEKLNTLVETRKSIQKQYFKRELDEATFNKMISEIQEKVLRTRAEIKELEEDKGMLLHLHVMEYRAKRKAEKEREKKKMKEKEKTAVPKSGEKKFNIEEMLNKVRGSFIIRKPRKEKVEALKALPQKRETVKLEEVEKRIKDIKKRLEKVRKEWSKE